MGVVFLEHPGGYHLFSCGRCNTVLANSNQIKNTHFVAETGVAYLFDKVVNLKYGKIQARDMISGHHFVRDVSCKRCEKTIGWFYEFVSDKRQRWKEGRVVLEIALLCEDFGIDEIE